MRRLNPDEAAAWGRVMATVKPLRAVPAPLITLTLPARTAPPSLSRREREETRSAQRSGKGEGERLPSVATKVARAPQNTLDGSWDRKLGRGAVMPDSSIDLHGHTLASAHALLDQGLERAIRRGDRVLLLVTGKPPGPESERPHARGAIRAAVADWIGASRHADGIAAVRGAHPRHGGQGALYIILRRPRGG